jgi:hypothetical protein
MPPTLTGDHPLSGEEGYQCAGSDNWQALYTTIEDDTVPRLDEGCDSDAVDIVHVVAWRQLCGQKRFDNNKKRE